MRQATSIVQNEVIVGLQTDKPFRRAIMPYGGFRMVENGLEAAGFAVDPQVKEIFSKYRKSHNDGVFDAYTPEIMRCRRSSIITGLPDAYGTGPHHRRLPPRRACTASTACWPPSRPSARRSTTCGPPTT